MRFLVRGILLIVLGFSAALALPFVLSSYYIDQRGVIIPGKVVHKREDVLVHRYHPRVEAVVSLEYDKPDGSGAGFLKVPMDGVEYDALHVGQPVSLHYLRPQDVPAVPFARSLRRMQLLPTVHMAGRHEFSGIRSKWSTEHIIAFFFPSPTTRPINNIRQASATVKSLERMTRLFQGTHNRGVAASDPIDIVGIQFVPEGRTDPVVAMDLIDADSLPGLREKASVPVEYELGAPRVAYIQGATRNFVRRNLHGLVVQGVLVVVVCGSLLLAARLLGRGYKRLISSSSSRRY